ncbi:MAG: flippase-like domain-containing protein [Proteobacteria bacterium]|nr:MAG: flippase-like domain-containing protein [Pseudomonadota bacterium]
MKQKIISGVKLALKFFFAFGILFYMVKSGRLELSVVKKGLSNGVLVSSAAVLLVTALLLTLQRWRLLLRGQGLDFSFGQVMRYGMIGQLFNTTMPGAVSGDLIKAWYVLADSKGHRKTPVLTSILLDRIMGVFGLVIVSASPILLFWNDVWSIERLHKMASIVLLLFVGVVCFFSYVLLSAWGPLAALRRKMEGLNKIGPGRILLQVYDSFVAYRERPGILFQALALSICTHVSVVTIIVLCGRTLGDDPLSIHHYFLLAPLGLFTTAVPVAPAGLGVGQVAFAALFELAGSVHGAEIFTMYVTMQILINLTGIFFYLRSPKPRSRHSEAQS